MALLVIFYLVLDYFVPMGPQWFQKVVFVVTQPFNWLGNNPLFVFIFMDLFDIRTAPPSFWSSLAHHHSYSAH